MTEPGPARSSSSADFQAERVRQGLNRAVLSNHLAELLASRRINCVVDVGAHRGEYGLLLRGLGYEGAIISFEPVSECFAELKERMPANQPWVGHPLALGARAGEADISVFEATDFSSLREPTPWGRRAFAGLAGDERERVKIARLDDLYPRLTAEIPEPRVMLKIDVQGFEWEVLVGAADTLRKVLAVQVETAVKPIYEGTRPYTEVIEHLGSTGFELSGTFPVSRDPELRIVELDCVLVRPHFDGRVQSH